MKGYIIYFLFLLLQINGYCTKHLSHQNVNVNVKVNTPLSQQNVFTFCLVQSKVLLQEHIQPNVNTYLLSISFQIYKIQNQIFKNFNLFLEQKKLPKKAQVKSYINKLTYKLKVLIHKKKQLELCYSLFTDWDDKYMRYIEDTLTYNEEIINEQNAQYILLPLPLYIPTNNTRNVLDQIQTLQKLQEEEEHQNLMKYVSNVEFDNDRYNYNSDNNGDGVDGFGKSRVFFF